VGRATWLFIAVWCCYELLNLSFFLCIVVLTVSDHLYRVTDSQMCRSEPLWRTCNEGDVAVALYSVFTAVSRASRRARSPCELTAAVTILWRRTSYHMPGTPQIKWGVAPYNMDENPVIPQICKDQNGLQERCCRVWQPPIVVYFVQVWQINFFVSYTLKFVGFIYSTSVHFCLLALSHSVIGSLILLKKSIRRTTETCHK